MLRKLFPFLIGLFAISITANSQSVINVPSDYSTIQVALNNATEGDTVLVQPSTYYENIIWPATNSIKLISAGDSSNTIIDGSEFSSVISIISDNIIDTTTIIKGFKITNGGDVQYGGGIVITKSGPTISNCWITRNFSQEDGGGMFFSYCIISKPILKNTIINNNEALGRGGGIYINKCYGYNMSFFIDKVIISDNKCTQQGAGICINRGDSLVITNSFFINNKVIYNGGGICFLNGGATARISNTTFIRNSASSGFGGGIRIYYSTKIDIINSTFFNNEAIFGGDAIMVDTEDSEVNVYKSNFHKNGYGYFNDNNIKIQIAKYNWWGSNNGPYHPTQNPNGLGDSTNMYVDVDPWLTEPDITAPPLPIQNVTIESIWPDSVKLVWDTSPIGDLAGYNVYFDTDSNNYVYDSYANQIDVGMDTSYVVKNLEAGKEYYITVTCYDNSGNESWYSEEIIVTPNPSPLIHAIHDTITFDTTFMNETLKFELIIVNTGTDTLLIDSVKFDISQFIGSVDSTTIAPADSAIVSVVFQPTTFGDIDGTLIIYSSAVNAPEKTIQLIAYGDYPEKPEINSIQDVPDDQGGQVRITFSRSKYDGLDNTYQIANYSVWRLENDDQWDAIGMFNAVQDSVYYYVAPTLCDSTVQGNCLSTFKVSAHTDNPDVFYYSDTLSSYSVDNIAPEAPQGLKSAIVANRVQLDWESNDEEDFQYYKIYRSDQTITDLSYSEIDSFTTVDTTYLDTEVEVDNQYYYRIVAYDYAGNRSGLSNEVNLEFTGIRDSQVLDKFNMGQNQPNPFVNSTTIQYTIPNHSFVNISVYSLLGKKLTTLVNEDKVSGSYSYEWSPDDIKPGIYFYILKAQDIVITRKLIVLDEF
jgi:hypothetical protein